MSLIMFHSSLEVQGCHVSSSVRASPLCYVAHRISAMFANLESVHFGRFWKVFVCLCSLVFGFLGGDVDTQTPCAELMNEINEVVSSLGLGSSHRRNESHSFSASFVFEARGRREGNMTSTGVIMLMKMLLHMIGLTQKQLVARTGVRIPLSGISGGCAPRPGSPQPFGTLAHSRP